MWRSLFVDMYENLMSEADDIYQTTVLGIHLFNISKGLQCTGLQEDDPEVHDILPKGWKANTQLYSFRYSFKSTIVYLKLLKASETKISIHAARSDKNDKIMHHSIDLTAFTSRSSQTEFIEPLIDEVLIPYEKAILAAIEIKGEAENPASKAKPAQVEKKRSILEDDSVPFGMPYGGGGFFGGNPYSNPFRAPGNLVGPNHPIFGQPQRERGVRWDPPAPFYMPNPDHFTPPGPYGFPGGPHGYPRGPHGFPPGFP